MAKLGSEEKSPVLKSWSPQWATHVSGTWEDRVVDLETGEIEPAIILLRCVKCSEARKVECKTGNVKTWINRFASVHYHSNPLDPNSVSEKIRRGELK